MGGTRFLSVVDIERSTPPHPTPPAQIIPITTTIRIIIAKRVIIGIDKVFKSWRMRRACCRGRGPGGRSRRRRRRRAPAPPAAPSPPPPSPARCAQYGLKYAVIDHLYCVTAVIYVEGGVIAELCAVWIYWDHDTYIRPYLPEGKIGQQIVRLHIDIHGRH